MLAYYLRHTAALRKSDGLFIHFSNQSQGQPLSPQQLSHWLCETTSLATTGLSPPDGLRAHSTRGISASLALHGDLSVQDIYSAVSWLSLTSFICFYLHDVSEPSLLAIWDPSYGLAQYLCGPRRGPTQWVGMN